MFATVSAFRMPWSESFMIFGDEGTLHAAPARATSAARPSSPHRRRTAPRRTWLEQVAGLRGDSSPARPPSESGQVNELLHFAECCRTGQTPLSSGRDNLETMKVVFGIYESSRLGRPFDLFSL